MHLVTVHVYSSPEVLVQLFYICFNYNQLTRFLGKILIVKSNLIIISKIVFIVTV